MSAIRETLKEAGYKFVMYLARGEVVFQDIESGQQEVWYANKNHANYGIVFNNTDWEYGYTPEEKV